VRRGSSKLSLCQAPICPSVWLSKIIRFFFPSLPPSLPSSFSRSHSYLHHLDCSRGGKYGTGFSHGRQEILREGGREGGDEWRKRTMYE